MAREVNGRGWTTKRWTTKDGREHRGRPLGKGDLYRILTNVIYTGQVNHKGTIYAGEHPAIVDAAVFEAVNERLGHNGLTGGKEVRNKYGALLRGLLHCDACGTAMLHTYTVKNGRRYRYYVCATAQQRGWDCLPQQVAAGAADRGFGGGARPRAGTEPADRGRDHPASARADGGGELRELRAELQAGERELRRLNADLVKVAATTGNGMRVDRLADLQDRIGSVERRISEIRAELGAMEAEAVSEEEVAAGAAHVRPGVEVAEHQRADPDRPDGDRARRLRRPDRQGGRDVPVGGVQGALRREGT